MGQQDLSVNLIKVEQMMTETRQKLQLEIEEKLARLKEQHNLEVLKFDEESKQMGFATVFHNRERSNVSDVTSFAGGNSNLSRKSSQEHMANTPFYSSGYGSSRP